MPDSLNRNNNKGHASRKAPKAAGEAERAAAPVIMVSLGSETLELAPQGQVNPDVFLKDMPRVLSTLARCKSLVLDFSQAREVDSLCLSSIVVLLRSFCSGFHHILLRGMEPWAADRLGRTGAEGIMGRGWSGSHRRREVRLIRLATPMPA